MSFIDFKINISMSLFSFLLIVFIVLLGTFIIPHCLHIGTDHVSLVPNIVDTREINEWKRRYRTPSGSRSTWGDTCACTHTHTLTVLVAYWRDPPSPNSRLRNWLAAGSAQALLQPFCFTLLLTSRLESTSGRVQDCMRQSVMRQRQKMP